MLLFGYCNLIFCCVNCHHLIRCLRLLLCANQTWFRANSAQQLGQNFVLTVFPVSEQSRDLLATKGVRKGLTVEVPLSPPNVRIAIHRSPLRYSSLYTVVSFNAECFPRRSKLSLAVMFSSVIASFARFPEATRIRTSRVAQKKV